MLLALQKGHQDGVTGLLGVVGRHLDKTNYRHTEIILSSGISVSSSYRDKGVRFKYIDYSEPGMWDFYPLPDHLEPRVIAWYLEHEGEEYDNMGNVRFLFGLIDEDKAKWFCTESNAAALGLPDAWRYSPGALLAILQYLYPAELIIG
jgi:hypothetical protein